MPYSQISMAQIDPNGLCNSGCWFCPVAYSPNPEFAKKTMPVETLESIVQQLHEGKGSFVSLSFDFIYTAHYNEVLLYAHFEDMLKIFRKYGFSTMVLSNGVPLTRERTDIIAKYPDVVAGICLNIPASNAEDWSRFTNMNQKIFSKVVQNVEYAINTLPRLMSTKALSIQVNGTDSWSLSKNGGWVDLLENAPKLVLDPTGGTLARQVDGFKKLFPGLNVFPMNNLIDRAGHLDTHKVISNAKGIEQHSKKDNTRVIGCGNGIEVGGRPNGWIHINANGDMFICCNDYDFDTIYGNVNDKPISKIWMSLAHRKMVMESYKTLCTTCSAAIWSKDV